MTGQKTIIDFLGWVSGKQNFVFIGEWRPTRSYCIMKSFSVQVFILWSILCIPGNVVTTYLYHTSNNNSITTLQESVENISSLKCHEQRSNWNHTVSTTRFALEGIVSTHCKTLSCRRQPFSNQKYI